MKRISSDGPFVLFEIKRIYHHSRHCGNCDNWYDIHLNDGMHLAATKYHAWVTIRNGRKIVISTERLKKDDKIWVDTSAFGGDQSLWKEGSPNERCLLRQAGDGVR